LHDEFRNEFAHFKPQGWGIKKGVLRQIVGTAVDCIERLMTFDDVSYKLDDNKKVRLTTAIEKTRRALEAQ
jgi:hypothetical protein